MAELIQAPSVITAAGYPPKRIEEYAGLVNNGEKRVSIALMRSPSGWSEPAQTARFDEYTLVLGGTLHLDLEEGGMDVSRGQAVLVRAGERVRYGSPGPEGAEYLSVCLPAFSPDTVNRETIRDMDPGPAGPGMSTNAAH